MYDNGATIYGLRYTTGNTNDGRELYHGSGEMSSRVGVVGQ